MDNLNLTDEVYSVTEVAKLFKVTKKAVYDWMSDGKLAYFYVGGQRRITRGALLAFIEASEETARKKEESHAINGTSFSNNRTPLRVAA